MQGLPHSFSVLVRVELVGEVAARGEFREVLEEHLVFRVTGFEFGVEGVGCRV